MESMDTVFVAGYSVYTMDISECIVRMSIQFVSKQNICHNEHNVGCIQDGCIAFMTQCIAKRKHDTSQNETGIVCVCVCVLLFCTRIRMTCTS